MSQSYLSEPLGTGWALTQSGLSISRVSGLEKIPGHSLIVKRGMPDARNFQTGGTAKPERREFARQITAQSMTDLRSHASGRVKELPQIFAGLAFALKKTWIQSSDILTVDKASFQEQRARNPLAAAHRALGQPRVNGITLPHVALLRRCSCTYLTMVRPYASVDFILSEFNELEFRWFESEKGKGAGARKRAEKAICDFVGRSRSYSEADILEAVEETRELAIITPLGEALNRCDSGDEAAAYVLLSEREASAGTTNSREDVSQSLRELDIAAAVDKN